MLLPGLSRTHWAAACAPSCPVTATASSCKVSTTVNAVYQHSGTISSVKHWLGWVQSTPYCRVYGDCQDCVCGSVLYDGGPAALSHALSPVPSLYGVVLRWCLQTFRGEVLVMFALSMLHWPPATVQHYTITCLHKAVSSTKGWALLLVSSLIAPPAANHTLPHVEPLPVADIEFARATLPF